jgi:hypothetical protein
MCSNDGWKRKIVDPCGLAFSIKFSLSYQLFGAVTSTWHTPTLLQKMSIEFRHILAHAKSHLEDIDTL